MKTIQETSAYLGDNRFSTPFYKLDIIRQAKMLLDNFGSSHLHKNKGVGNATKKARIYVVMQFIDDLRGLGFKIKNLNNLEQRHVTAVVGKWKAAKLSPSTIMNRLTHLRWLTTALGKRGFMKTPAEYGLEKEDIARTYVATVDKSWFGKYFITEELIGRATELDPWVGIKFEMMEAFGLRIAEAILARPRVSDNGNNLVVEDGTKGGKTRIVPIASPKQREILERAKALSLKASRGALISPERDDPEKERQRIYLVCRKLGLTKKELGVTPHGLRHGYANDEFKELTGVDSPVRGGPELPNTPEIVDAKQAISNALGHRRIQITAAYVGKTKMGRPLSRPDNNKAS
jgi:integrase